jgi:hypothetical protein
MKPTEALARHADLQNRLEQVRNRLRTSALLREGDQPSDEPESLLAEREQIADELERLIAAINHTNTATRLSSAAIVTEAPVRRDVLGARYSTLKAIADASRRGPLPRTPLPEG